MPCQLAHSHSCQICCIVWLVGVVLATADVELAAAGLCRHATDCARLAAIHRPASFCLRPMSRVLLRPVVVVDCEFVVGVVYCERAGLAGHTRNGAPVHPDLVSRILTLQFGRDQSYHYRHHRLHFCRLLVLMICALDADVENLIEIWSRNDCWSSPPVHAPICSAKSCLRYWGCALWRVARVMYSLRWHNLDRVIAHMLRHSKRNPCTRSAEACPLGCTPCVLDLLRCVRLVLCLDPRRIAA